VHFKAGGFHEALVSYHTALACLPPRKSRGKEKETTVEREPSDDEGESTDVPNVTEIIGSEDAEEVAESNEVGQAECAKARAVLNANIGACHVKLVSHCALSLKFIWNSLPGRSQRSSQVMHRR
jgi:hypothetical protein